MKITLDLGACGRTTCFKGIGKCCKFLRTRHFGAEWVCQVWDKEIQEDSHGWLLRLPECLAAEKNRDKPGRAGGPC